MSRVGWADLHHHSEYSLLDGYGRLDDHVARSKELGHSAVAFTEHGTMRGFVALEAAAKKHGIKPIYGCEFYVTADHTLKRLNPEQESAVRAGLKARDGNKAVKEMERAIGIHEARHLVAIALDEAGYRNLLQLNNIANREGFLATRAGGKARIDLNLLAEHNEGIAVSTACLGGVLAQSWLSGDLARLVDDASFLSEVFGDRFSIEIQPHPIPEQRRWNKVAMKLARDLGVPLIVTNDSHYIVEDDWKTHDALITMRFGKFLDDPDRIRYHPRSFALKSELEVEDAFEANGHDLPSDVIRSGIERAAELAERANATLWRPTRLLLPDVTGGKEEPSSVLQELVMDGWEWRDLDGRARRLGRSSREYMKRLSHELGVISKLKFAPYFLVVHDMIRWARGQGIMTGPGRGSAAGSLVCYLLGITSLDPIEHGLLFERFLTPGRKDWPDIDCDIERERRGEVLEYLRRTYGEDRVVQIGTINRMRGRSALRDVARVHGIPNAVVDKVTSTIVGSVIRAEGETSIAEALEESPALAAFAREHPEVVDTTLTLEGHVRHIGIHAAGVITSPIPLDDILPLEARMSKGEVVIATGYDMHDVESIGGIKIDLLGLKTLSVLADALRMITTRTGEVIDLEALTLDEPAVLKLFTDRDFIGVFQFDSPSARAACKGVRFDSFEDVASMNAINRPGVSKAGLDEEWKARKADPTKIVSLHPVIDSACADSLGVIIYQEHIIKILQDLAGFSPEEAGRLRKAISKSKGVGYLETEREPFVAGSMANGMGEDDANKLWSQIEQFGAYGFNKSHAAAYGAISYWCQWMKVHHPLEFYAALLMNESDQNKANRIVREAARRGVPVEPPDLNASGQRWTIRKGALVAGLSGIKGVGENACAEILNGQPFEDLPDFLGRVNRRIVNRGAVASLVKAGAIRPFCDNTGWLVNNIESVLGMVGKRKGWIDVVNEKLKESEKAKKLSEEDEWALRLEVGVAGCGEHPLGILRPMDHALLSTEWGRLDKPKDGDLLRGLVTSRKVGTSNGSKWASLELEDERGGQLRVRFNGDDYALWRDLIDIGPGALLAIRVAIGPRGGVVPEYVVDLLDLRREWTRRGRPLATPPSILNEWPTWQGCIIRGEHPCYYATKGTPAAYDWWESSKLVNVLVTRVKTVSDRNSNRMAFIRVEGTNGPSHEVVVFSSTWEALSSPVKPGDVIGLKAKIDSKKGTLIADSLVFRKT